MTKMIPISTTKTTFLESEVAEAVGLTPHHPVPKWYRVVRG